MTQFTKWNSKSRDLLDDHRACRYESRLTKMTGSQVRRQEERIEFLSVTNVRCLNADRPCISC